MKQNSIFLLSALFVIILVGCKKLIEIPPPASTITTSQVFSTNGQAAAAVSSMFSGMINQNVSYGSDGMTIFCGMSADELNVFNQSNQNYFQFQQDKLISSNSVNANNLWSNLYFTVYQANSIIEGLTNYSGVNDSLKNEYTGEAEFVRAFCNFYLVNLYGDIPLVSTINWRKTNLLNRTSTTAVYQSIIADLTDASKRLRSDYSAGNNQRIIPNKWVALALLSRVYLYQKQWSLAETTANTVIQETGLFQLDSLKNVFLANSNEAIWQLQQNNNLGPWYNVTPEGYQFIVPDTSTAPNLYLTTQMLNSFDKGDLRRKIWVDSTQYFGAKYYIPYKYKAGPLQASPGGSYSEYYMVFRLAEQFLIKAEAEANGAGDGLSGAISDLNKIRIRAGLLPYSGPLDQTSILNSIYHERKIELFAEWGHRWFDLKRTGTATTVVGPIKPEFTANAQLFPIPQSELLVDPNLKQNPGYSF